MARDADRLPVSVENDANCVLLAERWQGKAAEMANFLVLTIGTGIGGAIYCHHQLFTGRVFAPVNSATCSPTVPADAILVAIR
jgi:predicted NBD/HSP70 family sugar kinase